MNKRAHRSAGDAIRVEREALKSPDCHRGGERFQQTVGNAPNIWDCFSERRRLNERNQLDKRIFEAHPRSPFKIPSNDKLQFPHSRPRPYPDGSPVSVLPCRNAAENP